MGKIGVGISPTLVSFSPPPPPPPPPQLATLDPNPASMYNVTLSDGNLTARITDFTPPGTRYGSARSSSAKSSGKVYFEVWRVYDNNNVGAFMFGLSSVTPIQAANGAGLEYINSGIRLGAAIPTRVAIDFNAGKLWMSDSTWTDGRWYTGSDPVAGTVPQDSWTPGGLYCMFLRAFKTVDSYGTLEAWCSVNFGATPFVFSIPSGYTTWTQ